ncbi:unnamed protein product, partial [Heterotrigona itama]
NQIIGLLFKIGMNMNNKAINKSTEYYKNCFYSQIESTIDEEKL